MAGAASPKGPIFDKWNNGPVLDPGPVNEGSNLGGNNLPAKQFGGGNTVRAAGIVPHKHPKVVDSLVVGSHITTITIRTGGITAGTKCVHQPQHAVSHSPVSNVLTPKPSTMHHRSSRLSQRLLINWPCWQYPQWPAINLVSVPATQRARLILEVNHWSASTVYVAMPTIQVAPGTNIGLVLQRLDGASSQPFQPEQ